jgi:hypothetical protein
MKHLLIALFAFLSFSTIANAQSIDSVISGTYDNSTSIYKQPIKSHITRLSRRGNFNQHPVLRQSTRNHISNRAVYANNGNAMSSRAGHGIGGRPAAWCGWQMRQWFGGGPEYNLAINWASRGVATVAHVGAVVVWPHHVGYITGRANDGRWIVKSGNYANRIAEVPMSLRGVVAFRDLK